MEPLKNWMIGLDLTELDDAILKYTKLLSDVLNPKHIEVVHVAHKLSDSIHAHLANTMQYPTYDELLARVEEKAFKYFTNQDLVSCEIVEGRVAFDLWRESYLKDMDLFIAGSKEKHKGRGIIPKKFVRKSFCSVLFIPSQAPTAIKKIWIPVDFSDPSGDALVLGLHLAENMDPSAEVCIQHVYEMPHAYYYEGFPKEEIMSAVKKDAEKRYQEFNKRFNPHNLAIKRCFTALSKPFAADHLKLEAEKNQADLILMAAGGRSRFSRFFLGSETEKLVHDEKQLPLLVLKKKSQQVSLWDLLNP